MSVITVNAIGDTCPVPVIKAKQALAQMTEPGDLVVLVDNEVAVQNLTRMGASQGYAVQSEKTGDGNFQVRILVNALPQPEESAPDAACIPDARGDLVVAVDSAHMGRGSEELGATLMKGFLFAVGQLPRLPSTVLFYNGGASLSCEGSAALESLKSLEAQGVKILTCGTCLDYYGLTSKLAVGEVANMYTIVETLAGAGKVIKP